MMSCTVCKNCVDYWPTYKKLLRDDPCKNLMVGSTYAVALALIVIASLSFSGHINMGGIGAPIAMATLGLILTSFCCALSDGELVKEQIPGFFSGIKDRYQEWKYERERRANW